MATRNQGNYGSYRGNPYAGRGLGATQSPYVEPFVDYSRDMGKQMMSWNMIHQNNLNKIEEKVETRKADFLKAMDNATSIYLKDGLHGHQKDGSTIQVPKLNAEGKKILIDESDPEKGFQMEDKVLRGEAGDMQALVEEYRQNWLASRGITKKVKYDKDGNVKKTRLTGWASGSETTGGSLEARAEAEKTKAIMEDFAADKSTYKEEQAALYNDLGELNMIGSQTENESYDNYVKFMHPDNKTEFVKGRGMVIYSSDGDEITMKELAKLKPDLENPELQTNVNKVVDNFSSADLNKYVIHTQVPDGKGGFTTQQSLNIGMISRDIDTLFNGMNYDDIRDIIMNHSFRDNEGNPVNFYNSDVSRGLQAIYEAQAANDLQEKGVNYNMLQDREDKGKLLYKEKYFNDGNFIIDADFIEKVKNDPTELERLGLSKEEAETMNNFISNFQMPENLRGKNMPMSRYVQEKVKDYYGKIGQDLVNSRLSAPKPVDEELELKRDQLNEKIRATKAKEQKELREWESKQGDKWTLLNQINFVTGENPEKINKERFVNMFDGATNGDGAIVSFDVQQGNQVKSGEPSGKDFDLLKVGDIITVGFNYETDQSEVAQDTNKDGVFDSSDTGVKSTTKVKSRAPEEFVYNGKLDELQEWVRNKLDGYKPDAPITTEEDKTIDELRRLGLITTGS